MYDNSDLQQELGQRIDGMLRSAFGKLVGDPDGQASRVFLPGGTFCTVVTTSGDDVVTVHKMVGTVELVPGLAETLMREHGTAVFGRHELDRNGMLSVEHSIPSEGLTPDVMYRLVLCVHKMAIDCERLLDQAGVLVSTDVPD